ncbi:alpha/beta hydrolase family protein [Bordetella bronchiseptica GA96-01]|uniref:alpha/beta fold hydrolase n=1 Tax=Bordetella bronchiseptica TaxID=518 RepID=UPI00045B3AAB|nr:alpha/beta hydrolase [Bordetella bronchiseptica]KDD50622.1 alpha/beta hydrolase family protein [Bordetella bronchiseptica OSU553]AUL16826.1 hydrolase [Bordetella bronchiseptica]AWP60052.1 hydrolase [Bordetella bronchiseptica]AWQ06818.1 hydrolase [Bordetella bronchiseptica]AZW32286.1 hydrolase [Bordetella bronchiseptica]
MPHMQLGDVQIHYDVIGDGPPLVMTTGLGTGPQSRREMIAQLAREYSVVTYHQRGTGKSSPGPQGQAIEALADDIVALMDHLKFERVRLIGLSTGTGKATVVAARHPGRVEKLVLAAPWTHGDDLLDLIQHVRMAAADGMPAELYAQFNAVLLYPPRYRREHASRFAAAAADAAGVKTDAAGLRARLQAILRFDARPLYPLISSPTLVMAARDDLVMPAWFAQSAAASISDARLIVLGEGGHMFPETRTEEFLSLVLPFLRRA